MAGQEPWRLAPVGPLGRVDKERVAQVHVARLPHGLNDRTGQCRARRSNASHDVVRRRAADAVAHQDGRHIQV